MFDWLVNAIKPVSPIARRFQVNPIITPDMLPPGDGRNINGPSLIRVPDWITRPLGNYYLYFAHHQGRYIRLAYADTIAGPWKIYTPGTLNVMQTAGANFPPEGRSERKHIASPDVHINGVEQVIVMYYHTLLYKGPDPRNKSSYNQATFRATSPDGINFTPENGVLGPPYFRVFKWRNTYYAMARLGQLFRSVDGRTLFEKGPNPFLKTNRSSTLRHVAVHVQQDLLSVYFSRFGDRPESIYHTTIRLTDDWNKWKPERPRLVLRPEESYEGAGQPRVASTPGMSRIPQYQLRDPAIFAEGDKTYLLYSVAGEAGIALAEIKSHA